MSFVCCNDILFEGLQSRNQNVLYVSFVIPSINSKWAPHNVRKGHSTSTSLIVFLFSSVTGQEKEGPVHTISRRPDPTKVLTFTLLPTRLTATEILMRHFSSALLCRLHFGSTLCPINMLRFLVLVVALDFASSTAVITDLGFERRSISQTAWDAEADQVIIADVGWVAFCWWLRSIIHVVSNVTWAWRSTVLGYVQLEYTVFRQSTRICSLALTSNGQSPSPYMILYSNLNYTVNNKM